LDGAGFAFRGDHRIASISMQANPNYTMTPVAEPHSFGGLILYPCGI